MSPQAVYPGQASLVGLDFCRLEHIFRALFKSQAMTVIGRHRELEINDVTSGYWKIDGVERSEGCGREVPGLALS